MKDPERQTFPLETAGRLMTDKVPTVLETATISEVEKLFVKNITNFETVNYIYVLNNRNQLLGAISIKEIFRSPKETLVKDLMPPKIISVRTHTDQERVALLALQNNLKAIPVVDKENHFLGVVPSDEILRVLDNETVEDILRFGGVLHKGSFDNILNISLIKSLKHRLPWLVLGLLGGVLAAGVVSNFEKTLAKNLILAAFIPLIVYMADAVGTQMEAFIIRDLALNPKLNFPKYFFRQLSIVSLIGVVTSFLLAIVSLILYQRLEISFVLTISLFFAILSSVFTGLGLPFLFGKLKLDPANASGPIATIIQDFLSVFIYLTIASWLL